FNQALKAALETRPNQPLLVMLQALSFERGNKVLSEAEAIAALRRVAVGGSADLLHVIAAAKSPMLTSDQTYDILLSEPVAQRSVATLDQLAKAALAAFKPREALQHVQAAIKIAGAAHYNFNRELLLVEL